MLRCRTLTLIAGDVHRGPLCSLVFVFADSALLPAQHHLHLKQSGRTGHQRAAVRHAGTKRSTLNKQTGARRERVQCKVNQSTNLLLNLVARMLRANHHGQLHIVLQPHFANVHRVGGALLQRQGWDGCSATVTTRK